MHHAKDMYRSFKGCMSIKVLINIASDFFLGVELLCIVHMDNFVSKK